MNERFRSIKKEVTKLVMAARSPVFLDRNTGPRYVAYDDIIRIGGHTAKRKKVILMTHGCSMPTCTMCPFTNENFYGTDGKPDLDIVNQVRGITRVTADAPAYEVLALYNDGSFFAPREVSDSQQIEIADIVSQSVAKELVVESLPQFITRERLKPFIHSLGNVHLEVGIGLQSSNAFVREVCVNTSFSNECFEQAVSVLRDLCATPKVYLMIKPPFLNEAEGIADAVQSIKYISDLGLPSVTLCPTRVAKNTLAWDLHRANLYTPPNLWSIVEVLKRAVPHVQLRVACINLRGSDFESVFPDSCDSCADQLVDAFERYSLSGNLGHFQIQCDCTRGLPEADDTLDVSKIEKRVHDYLSVIRATAVAS